MDIDCESEVKVRNVDLRLQGYPCTGGLGRALLDSLTDSALLSLKLNPALCYRRAAEHGGHAHSALFSPCSFLLPVVC
jgi:hypothetical protein